MTIKLGCVLAVRDRPVDVLERTLQTHAYQTVQPMDRVLLDYGSGPELAAAYRGLGERYGWRVVPVEPAPPVWQLSDAYNRAVEALAPEVEVVFKSDADVLLGQDVLEGAALLGLERLCIFPLLTTAAGATYPPTLASHGDLLALLAGPPGLAEMQSEGTFACPRQWFVGVGGFDRHFRGWGFEDSDLRERAKASIGLVLPTTFLLVHQGHPSAEQPEAAARNRAYYERMKRGPVVRNGGLLREAIPAAARNGHAQPPDRGDPPEANDLGKIVVATRSMSADLYAQSGELLQLVRLQARTGRAWVRHRLTGTDALGYFRQLLDLDADWVVNLDEDAFLLRPESLIELIEHMKTHGQAACGMPDGGVVPIRRHHPAACNAFFNVFNLARVRHAWADWERIHAAVPRPAHEEAAPFARRSTYAFDHFERYYGVFFSLLDGEKILYLDAETWQDGLTTVLKDARGEPLLLHCWYSRYWETSRHTRQRYQAALAHARHAQAKVKEGAAC